VFEELRLYREWICWERNKENGNEEVKACVTAFERVRSRGRHILNAFVVRASIDAVARMAGHEL
jgi:hypothetical protein